LCYCGSVTLSKSVSSDGKVAADSNVEVNVGGNTYQGRIVELGKKLQPAKSNMKGDYYFDEGSGKDLMIQVNKK